SAGAPERRGRPGPWAAGGALRWGCRGCLAPPPVRRRGCGRYGGLVDGLFYDCVEAVYTAVVKLRAGWPGQSGGSHRACRASRQHRRAFAAPAGREGSADRGGGRGWRARGGPGGGGGPRGAPPPPPPVPPPPLRPPPPPRTPPP